MSSLDSPDPSNITLIIPAYNESQTIQTVIETFFREIPEAHFLIIDNASTDNTAELATQTIQTLNCKGRVIHEPRPGKGMAIRTAFDHANTDIIVMVDADCTYPADAIHDLIQPIHANSADMVIGNRHANDAYKKQNTRAFHNLGNWLVTTLIRKLFYAKTTDILSGYRAFSKRFIKCFAILSKGFEIETEMTLHALDKRYRVMEIPIDYYQRPEGSVSKLNTTRDGIRVVKTIITIFRQYRPLLFFSIMSALFLSSGFVVGYPVIKEFFQTGFILKIPSAILASSLMIIAIVLIACGLILDTVVTHHRREHELWRLSKK